MPGSIPGTGYKKFNKKTCIMNNFKDYSKNAIHDSIIALGNDIETIKDYYGNANNCNLENYFSAQIKGDSIYDSVDEMSEETIISKITDEMRADFENARSEEYTEFISNYYED